MCVLVGFAQNANQSGVCLLQQALVCALHEHCEYIQHQFRQNGEQFVKWLLGHVLECIHHTLSVVVPPRQELVDVHLAVNQRAAQIERHLNRLLLLFQPGIVQIHILGLFVVAINGQIILIVASQLIQILSVQLQKCKSYQVHSTNTLRVNV